MTKAQDIFTTRDQEDSRKFETWYHNDDVQWLVWQHYQQLPESIEEVMLPPYVFFDGEFSHKLEDLMWECSNQLLNSEATFFPIIFKPELGSAHYMSAILRKNPDNDETCTMFLFNPTGFSNEKLTPEDYAKARLGLEEKNKIGGMDLVICHQVAQKEKFEKETASGHTLVSCGPMSVAFIQYAMSHPEWVEKLDTKNFVLPPELEAFAKLDDKEQYRQAVAKLRAKHYGQLSDINDDDYTEEEAANFFAPITAGLLEVMGTQDQSHVETHSLDFDEYLEQQDEQKGTTPVITEEDSHGSSQKSNLGSTSLTQEPQKDTQSSTPVPQSDIPSSNQQVGEEAKSPLKSDESDQEEQSKAYRLALVAFETHLKELQKVTDSLKKKGAVSEAAYNPAYMNVAEKVKQFHQKLEQAKTTFEKNLTQDGLQQFKQECTDAITGARDEFAKHRGVWHNLHPIIKGIIGVLATITVIPAVLVAISKQGYVDTFFRTPKTKSAEALDTFEENLDNTVYPKK
ncbi:hypothetical protein [Legionella sp. W05-934-2]|uniref:hypothetical protein n=1 Tax=Legionella sp. W05-934-2 TaxID=1198649 RepID=UPI00346281BC